MSALTETLDGLNLVHTNTVWTMIINELRKIEDVVIDEKMLKTLNDWSNDTLRWPYANNIYDITPADLVKYRGENIRLNLSGRRGWNICVMTFDACYTNKITENRNYTRNLGYRSPIDENIIIDQNTIAYEERTGRALEPDRVISNFTRQHQIRHFNKIDWQMEKHDLAWVKEKMDVCIKRILDSHKTKDMTVVTKKIHARYLKNRWPLVNAYLKANPGQIIKG